MKLFSLLAFGALILQLGSAHAQTPLPAAEIAARDGFEARMEALRQRNQWPTILKSAREWRISHPDDPNAYSDPAHAAFMLGDVDSAIADWSKLLELHPDQEKYANHWLDTGRAVRRNYPNLKLKPLQFVLGDAGRESTSWYQKAGALLEAKKYDEIEKIAANLQKSNSANAKGTPYLDPFFDGLVNGNGSSFAALQSKVAVWRKARPQSLIARLVAIDIWTRAAWKARGTGTSDTITPAMSAQMEVALRRAAVSLQQLPDSAFRSPLFFIVALDWAQLSGIERPFLDQTFAEGIQKFPDYLPLYLTRAYHLLPRWFGEPGEWEAMAEGHADRIGGENGDIFYGRIVWSLADLVEINRESDYDYERVRRGLEILHRRRPNSASVSSARLALAYQNKVSRPTDWWDLKTLQQVFSAPQGHLFDNSWRYWSTNATQNDLTEQRMQILAQAPSQ